MFNHNSHGNGLLGFTGLLLLGAVGVLLYQNKPGFFLSLLTFIHDYPQLLPQAAQTAKGGFLLTATAAGAVLLIRLFAELCRRGFFRQLILQTADTLEAFFWLFDLTHEDPAEEFAPQNPQNATPAEPLQASIDLQKDMDELAWKEQTVSAESDEAQTRRFA